MKPGGTAGIDELYGLEPVFEPDASAPTGEPTVFVSIQCPYCSEHYETRVDLTGGSFTCIEDCQICCQPIEIEFDVSDAGRLVAVKPERMD